MSVLTNPTSTARSETATTQPREVSRQLFRYDGDNKPLNLLLNAAGKKRRQIKENIKFEHFEKSRLGRATTVTGSHNSSVTTFTVADATIFSVNEVVRNLRTNELLRVLAKTSSTTFTVAARGFASSSAATMNDADVLIRLGTAYAQGAGKQAPTMQEASGLYGYPQIWRRPYGTNKTMQALTSYLGNDLTERGVFEANEMATDIEWAYILGKQSYDGSTDPDHPLYTTGGLIEKVTTNVWNVAGALTEAVLWTRLNTIFRYGSDTKLALCSGTVINAISGYARGRMQGMEGKVNVAGLDLQSYETGHGTLLLKKHKLISDYLDGYMFVIDLENIQDAYVTGRDNKHNLNIEDNGDDGTVNEWLAERGLDIWGEKTHGILYGITG